MNILFLNNFFYLRGGSEKVLFEEMRLLRQAGHEVAVFSRANCHNEPSEYDRYFPAAIDTDRLGVNPRSLLTAKELIYSHAARKGVRQVIEAFKPDIAHAHNIYGRLSVSVLDELKAAKVPTVLTLHDLKLLCPSYLMLNDGQVCERCKGNRFHHAVLSRCHKGSYPASAVYALESWINSFFGKYDSVASFIAPSRFLRDKVVEFKGNACPIVHIPNFIDTGSRLAANSGKGYCLYLGRLSREKGVMTLLRAFRGLKRKTDLVVVGDGPARTELQLFAEENALAVRFTGYLNGRGVAEAIAGAKVIIMPSEWYENAPLSLLEAFACGKPVIGAQIGGIPEMIDDGVNGLLFPTGNVDELRDRIDYFLSLADKTVMEMGKAAREKVMREYSAENHLQRLLQTYRSCLHEKELRCA